MNSIKRVAPDSSRTLFAEKREHYSRTLFAEKREHYLRLIIFKQHYAFIWFNKYIVTQHLSFIHHMRDHELNQLYVV
jgi:hypothetical protein